jgi:uncharacterized protein
LLRHFVPRNDSIFKSGFFGFAPQSVTSTVIARIPMKPEDEAILPSFAQKLYRILNNMLIINKFKVNISSNNNLMEKFSPKTIENLKYYVYALLDPRDKKIFYVGKGKGNRVFAHMRGAIKNPEKSDKISTINNIIKSDKKVQHYILRHGVDDQKTALEIEATIINLLTFTDYKHLSKITNIVSGYHSWDRGIKTVNDIEIIYSAKPLNENKITHNLLLININKTYESGLSIYEATRKNWKLKEERVKKIDFVCGEYKGIIRGIYKPEKWYHTKNRKRMYFEGTDVKDQKIIKMYLNKAYLGKKKGQANPIKYLDKQLHYKI